MKEKACCFTGHRKILAEELFEIKEHIEEEIKFLFEYVSIQNFATGGALGFDTLAAEMVLALKQVEPKVRLILVLPFQDQARFWKRADRENYQNIMAKADEVIYTSQSYGIGCYHKRNRYLVDNSTHCICYVRQESGGAWYTREYAKQKKLCIIKL